MNPYDDFVFIRIADLAASNDVTFPLPGAATPLRSAHVPINQSEQAQQTVQSELPNPYADVVFSSSLSPHDQNAVHPMLVQSESVTVDENGDYFLSADHANQSEALNSHSLAVVTAQYNAEAEFANLDPERSNNALLSADHTDYSDASNPDSLSIVMEPTQAEAEIMNPDLECSICFSQFNNAFRCPKRLSCGHTFCLECLARMNVKSSEPSLVQCPLCRTRTPLPALGLPKLSTDPEVLSCLPDSMQRVYSVRFLRNKGRLQLTRPDAASRNHSTRRSLDVGLPSPVSRGTEGRARGGVGGALFRLIDRPASRALLLIAVIMMIVLLTAIIVFLLMNHHSL